MGTRSPTLGVRVRGSLACFTRPECKAERFSYEVMTPSAARGILEAILWKPEMRWRIERIHVLAPIRFVGLRRNEVGNKIPAAAGPARDYFADDDRQQRQTFALRDVDYLVEAYIELTPKAGPGDGIVKYVEMFRRRIDSGQVFQRPYLGCREFPADLTAAESKDGAWVDAVTGEPLMPAEEGRRALGVMLLDLEYGRERAKPRFFEAELDRGVLVEAGQQCLPQIGGPP